MKKRAQNLVSRSASRFLRNLVDKQGGSCLRFYRENGGIASSYSSFNRRLDEEERFDADELLQAARAGSTILHEPVGQVLMTLGGEPVTSSVLEEMKLASRYWRMRSPKTQQGLGPAIHERQRSATRLVSCNRILPVCVLLDDVIKRHTEQFALEHSLLHAEWWPQRQFGLDCREDFMQNGFGRITEPVIYVFNSDFERMAALACPFNTCTAAMIHEQIVDLIHCAVRDRDLRLLFVNDKHPEFPPILRKHFDRFDYVLTFDDQFVMQRLAKSFDRMSFDRRDHFPGVAELIDQQLRMLHALDQWVFHERTERGIVEQLKTFLPQ